MGCTASSAYPAAVANDNGTGGMHAGISFRQFPLIARETVSLPGASHAVVLLTFRLPDKERGLGLAQPTTHVKVRLPTGTVPKARTFSLMSYEHEKGCFRICVKVHPGGAVSPWLAQLPLGSPVPIAKTMTKRTAAPLFEQDARGHGLGMVAFGVGITECLLTAWRACAAGQRVVLLYAARTCVDVLFARELMDIARQFPWTGEREGKGQFQVHVAVSREDIPASFLDSASHRSSLRLETGPGTGGTPQDTGSAGAGAGAMPTTGLPVPSSFHIRRGRVDSAQLQSVFQPLAQAVAQAPAVLVIGSKAQMRGTYAQLAGLGYRKRLLGKPIVGKCW